MNGQYKEGNVVLQNWKLTHKLGEGSFGKVYEAEITVRFQTAMLKKLRQ